MESLTDLRHGPVARIERLVKHHADVLLDHDVVTVDLAPEHFDAPGLAGQHAQHALDRRRLPGAIAPDETHDVALGQAERYICEREARIGLAQAGDVQRVTHDLPP
jgi:hypothetical protein